MTEDSPQAFLKPSFRRKPESRNLRYARGPGFRRDDGAGVQNLFTIFS
jgi:hypothetical protein